jgi:hypothetical protein
MSSTKTSSAADNGPSALVFTFGESFMEGARAGN